MVLSIPPVPTWCRGVVLVHRDGTLQCTEPRCPAHGRRPGLLRHHVVFAPCPSDPGGPCRRCAPAPPVAETASVSRLDADASGAHRRPRGRGYRCRA